LKLNVEQIERLLPNTKNFNVVCTV